MADTQSVRRRSHVGLRSGTFWELAVAAVIVAPPPDGVDGISVVEWGPAVRRPPPGQTT